MSNVIKGTNGYWELTKSDNTFHTTLEKGIICTYPYLKDMSTNCQDKTLPTSHMNEPGNMKPTYFKKQITWSINGTSYENQLLLFYIVYLHEDNLY